MGKSFKELIRLAYIPCSTPLSQGQVKSLTNPGIPEWLEVTAIRTCFHEAGHALIACAHRRPIVWLSLVLSKSNYSDFMFFKGSVQMEETDHDRKELGDLLGVEIEPPELFDIFLKEFSIHCAGIVAELENFDLKTINHRKDRDNPVRNFHDFQKHVHKVMGLFRKHYPIPYIDRFAYQWWGGDLLILAIVVHHLEKKIDPAKVENMGINSIWITQKIIKDNQQLLSKLAGKLYKSLLRNDMSIIIKGKEIMDFFGVKG
jgi:hypothetical protein